jgi:hypothetical protein
MLPVHAREWRSIAQDQLALEARRAERGPDGRADKMLLHCDQSIHRTPPLVAFLRNERAQVEARWRRVLVELFGLGRGPPWCLRLLPRGVEPEWQGRGRGRRHIFLARLNAAPAKEDGEKERGVCG